MKPEAFDFSFYFSQLVTFRTNQVAYLCENVLRDSFVAIRCCLHDAESSESVAEPGRRFCSKCRRVQVRPQLKPKKLCECFQHKTQRCGPDPANVDERCPLLNKGPFAVEWSISISDHVESRSKDIVIILHIRTPQSANSLRQRSSASKSTALIRICHKTFRISLPFKITISQLLTPQMGSAQVLLARRRGYRIHCRSRTAVLQEMWKYPQTAIAQGEGARRRYDSFSCYIFRGKCYQFQIGHVVIIVNWQHSVNYFHSLRSSSKIFSFNKFSRRCPHPWLRHLIRQTSA